MTHRYEMLVSWSPEDAVYVVEVPELPGCLAHGNTPTEAVESAQEAITLWIATAREQGRVVPAPRGRILPVR